MRLRPLMLVPLMALAARPAGAAEITAHYVVHALGMTVMRIEARIALDDGGYHLRLVSRTVGLARQIVTGGQETSSEGGWRAAGVLPGHYRMRSRWRGTERTMALDWPRAGAPPRVAMHPVEDEDDREPVPEALQAGTMDGLSAIALLSRTVQRTGRCDAGAAAYDGRRRTDYRVHTEGEERLPGGWQGLRCGLEIRTVAGFRRDADRTAESEPRPGTLWMGTVLAGLPPVPLRVEVPSRWFGMVRVDLERAEPSAEQPGEQGR